jgi:cation transport ATPase
MLLIRLGESLNRLSPDEQEQLVADGVNDAPRADADVGIAIGRGGRRQASRGTAASVVRQLAHVRKASLPILLI